MRALLTCRPLAGHYRPMLPLARALAEAGHDVAFASGEPVVGEAEAEGFTAFRVGLASDAVEPLARRVRDRAASLPPSQVRPFVFTELFVRVELEPRANDLFDDRRAVGAARCRTRRRGVRRTARRNHGRHPVRRAQLRACHPERRHPCRRRRHCPLLEPRTASRRTPSVASTATCTSTCARPASRYPKRLPGAVQGIRTVETRPPETQLPWLDALRGLPIVYITLGTVYNRNLGVFRSAARRPPRRSAERRRHGGQAKRPCGARSAAVERPRAPVHPARAAAPSLRRCRDARWRRLDARCTRVRPAAPHRPPRRRSLLQRRTRRCRRRRQSSSCLIASPPTRLATPFACSCTTTHSETRLTASRTSSTRCPTHSKPSRRSSNSACRGEGRDPLPWECPYGWPAPPAVSCWNVSDMIRSV